MSGFEILIIKMITQEDHKPDLDRVILKQILRLKKFLTRECMKLDQSLSLNKMQMAKSFMKVSGIESSM